MCLGAESFPKHLPIASWSQLNIYVDQFLVLTIPKGSLIGWD
jgi:hypothetical protein